MGDAVCDHGNLPPQDGDLPLLRGSLTTYPYYRVSDIIVTMPYSDRKCYADAEGVLSNISSGTGLIVHSDNIVIFGKKRMLETLEPG